MLDHARGLCDSERFGKFPGSGPVLAANALDIQFDDVPAEPEQSEDGKCHDPVQQDRHEAEAFNRILYHDR